jgi:hypothetical protein
MNVKFELYSFSEECRSVQDVVDLRGATVHLTKA